MFVVSVFTSVGWLVFCECATYVEAYRMADKTMFPARIEDETGHVLAD